MGLQDFLKSATTKNNQGFTYQAPNFNLGGLTSLFGGATKPGQVNSQNQTPNVGPQVPAGYYPQKPASSPTKPAAPAAPTAPQKYGSPDIGYYNSYQEALNALNKVTPPAVNIKVGEEIPSSALDTTQTPTSLREKSKQTARNVMSNKYDKEIESLMSNISTLRSGIVDLTKDQAKEYYDLKQNPEGMLTHQLAPELGRLSELQAIELNARTGQLQSYLDTLEMYQGYAPQIIGTPQIDEATGNGFAYIQDPMTGEITVQDLGQLGTPPAQEGVTLGEGQIRYEYDAEGKLQPVAYGAKKTTGGGSGPGLFSSYGASGKTSNIIDQIAANITTENQRDYFLGTAQQLLASGDTKELNNFLRRQAVNSLGMDLKGKYVNNINVIEQLETLEGILGQMEAKGVSSNILKGTWQTIINKVGGLGDPSLLDLAYQARNTMDIIARARTGAAFTSAEDKMYKSMVPGILKTPQLNTNMVRNLRTSIENSLDAATGLSISSESREYLKSQEKPKKSLEELAGEL